MKVLNPYEVSVVEWTPTYKGTTVAGTFTYVSQVGRATVLGPLVFVQGVCALSAIGVAPTGNMTIAGLPLPVSAVPNGGVAFSFISHFNYSLLSLQLMGVIVGSGNVIDLYESFINAVAVRVPAANFTNVNCNLQFFGYYMKG